MDQEKALSSLPALAMNRRDFVRVMGKWGLGGPDSPGHPNLQRAEEALEFIRDHAQEPFFLYLPFAVPHVSLQVPEDSLVEYSGTLDDTPYTGDRGYLPHPEPRAAYAAMITRMDREIGRDPQTGSCPRSEPSRSCFPFVEDRE